MDVSDIAVLTAFNGSGGGGGDRELIASTAITLTEDDHPTAATVVETIDASRKMTQDDANKYLIFECQRRGESANGDYVGSAGIAFFANPNSYGTVASTFGGVIMRQVVKQIAASTGSVNFGIFISKVDYAPTGAMTFTISKRYSTSYFTTWAGTYDVRVYMADAI